MIRVAGKVEFIRDKALEERLYRDQLWVSDLIAKGTEPAIFRVAHGEAYFWTMADNMREHDASRVKF
jgi:hypothetical protein